MLTTCRSAFGCLWILYLSAPATRAEFKQQTDHGVSLLGGGLNMSLREASLITAIIGAAGVPLQVLFYPWVQERFGTVRSYRLFSIAFPISYLVIPFVSLLPLSSKLDRILLWVALVAILILHTIGRVISVPATIAQVNDCAPHPTMLGTINGLGQAVSAAFRTMGPVVGASVFAASMSIEALWIPWCLLALVAVSGTILIK